MRSNRQDALIISFADWLKTPPGAYVLAWEQLQLDALVADIFGYHAVQVGLPQLVALRSSRMTMTCMTSAYAESVEMKPDAMPASGQGVSMTATAQRPLVLATPTELPFAAQSIDLIVLPHKLEFAADPHQILREVERVLIPEGQLIISGFNPLSLWGARQILGQMLDSHFLPGEGQFLALPRLKDWLKLLSFEVQRGRYGCYRPPLRTEQWLGRYGFMEKAGDRWWPICGAVYMISAIKRVHGMRLIGPLWKDSKAVVRGLSPVATPSSLPSNMNADQAHQAIEYFRQ